MIDKAESMHDDHREAGAAADAATAPTRWREVRRCCDELELSVSDELWPLPKYREMLFPV